MPWSEVNMKARVWAIPASRMKAGRPHFVPLSDEAIEVLEQMEKGRIVGQERVFPGRRGGLLSDVAVNKTLHAIAPDVSVHGFRTSFRIWGAEKTRYPREVLEAALAHVNKDKVEAAYQRSDLFDLRRDVMPAWGAFATGKDARPEPEKSAA
jgi:integrase